MPRRRLGVVLLLRGPVAAEVDGLRRACGDTTLGRVPSHITLVPPVNVHEADLPAALSRVRAAASSVRDAIEVTLGPPDTFSPVNPVLYLAVGGPGLEAVHRLRTAVFAYPLERTLSWDFVPHVTIADDTSGERIAAALVALADYTAPATFERVHLLEESPGHTWNVLADCPLGPADVVGRGGFEVELTTSETLDPEAAGFLAAYEAEPGRPPYVVARHRWKVAGVADAEQTTVAPEHEAHGIADLLASRRGP